MGQPPTSTTHPATRRAADTGIVPHGAREVFRLRASSSGVVSFTRELVPALIPPTMRGSQLCGKRLGAFGDPKIYTRLRTAFRRAVRTHRAVRVDWPSILTGKLRIAAMVPLRDGGVMVRVFAEAEEVAGVADERRRTDGTNGD